MGPDRLHALRPGRGTHTLHKGIVGIQPKLNNETVGGYTPPPMQYSEQPGCRQLRNISRGGKTQLQTMLPQDLSWICSGTGHMGGGQGRKWQEQGSLDRKLEEGEDGEGDGGGEGGVEEGGR